MGYWVGDESDPWNPDSDSGNQRDNPAAEIGARVGDLGGDFAGTITGTTENAGWFGAVDRGLDPRNPDEWADVTDATTGISGFFAGLTGAGSAAVGEAVQGVQRGLGTKLMLILTAAAGTALFVLIAYLLRPWITVAAGGSE